MVVLRTETLYKCNNSFFKRDFLLYSVSGKKEDIFFAVDKPEILRDRLKKSPEIFNTKDIEQILDNDIETVIFDLKEPGSEDILLAEKAIKQGARIVQLIETPQRILDGAYLIEQSCIPLSDGTKTFLSGPKYTILHNRFIHFNNSKRKFRKKVKKIFIALNETFSYREVRKIIDNLVRHGFQVKTDPGNYLKKFNRKTLKRIYPEIRFTGKRDNHARAFFEADISITVPGIRSYESLATGTPSIFLYANDTEKKIARYLEEKGTGLAIEKEHFLKEANITGMINAGFSGEKLETSGKECKKLIDGRGLYRVTELLKKEKLI